MKEKTTASFFWSIVYDISVNGGRFSKRIAGMLRDRKVAHTEYQKQPLIQTEIQGEKVIFPLSSNIPIYQKLYPTYDRAIAFIAESIIRDAGELAFVDVGANVGDTVINIGIKEKARYLLIEGDPYYLKLINNNISGAGIQYDVVQTFLSDKDTVKPYTIEHRMSSAKLIQADKGGIQLRTLDTVIKEKSFVPNLLKIDTDGFDIKVLKGARETLNKYHPFIFFEWHPTWAENIGGEDSLSIFSILNELGYTKALLFDNYGNPLVNIVIDDIEKLSMLRKYTMRKNAKIQYFDIFVIPEYGRLDISLIINRFDSFLK